MIRPYSSIWQCVIQYKNTHSRSESNLYQHMVSKYVFAANCVSMHTFAINLLISKKEHTLLVPAPESTQTHAHSKQNKCGGFVNVFSELVRLFFFFEFWIFDEKMCELNNIKERHKIVHVCVCICGVHRTFILKYSV